MRVAMIQGHPDPAGGHFCHALVEAYARGVRAGGHDVRLIDVAQIDFPLLRTKQEFENGAVPEAIRAAQEAIAWADHLLICYPLWLGTLPALLKGFLEQTFRYGFAMQVGGGGKSWQRLLKGKSARIVVTMGMPAFFYRWYFGAHGLKSLERSILAFAGIGPIRESLIGMVDGRNLAYRTRWLAKLERFGRRAR
jgi:putative NADPH-quinone reductase